MYFRFPNTGSKLPTIVPHGEFFNQNHFKKVRVEIGGMPIIDIDAEPGESGRQKKQIRRMRGGRKVKLEWLSTKPRLVLTSDTDDFDETIISRFQQECFQISYLACEGDQKAYHNALNHLADGLELGDRYAIVAYGDAAALCLEACTNPIPKLAALIAYYPPYMPSTNTNFPSTLFVQIHLAGSSTFNTRHPSFRYPDTKPGFAEHDLAEYNKAAATLAWSRALSTLRRALNTDLDVNLEAVWDNHTRLELEVGDADETMKTMVAEPYGILVPTMTGGIGAKELRRFYADYFIPGNPQSLKITVLSRTVGSDRVVDEMLCTFRHTCEMPWLIPGIPATDKLVEVMLVVVVCIRGGKLYHEHIYWDQATVLVQLGLLDPKHVPEEFKTSEPGREKEITRLPVVGREGTRKLVDKNEGESNLLIPGWKKERTGKEKEKVEE